MHVLQNDIGPVVRKVRGGEPAGGDSNSSRSTCAGTGNITRGVANDDHVIWVQTDTRDTLGLLDSNGNETVAIVVITAEGAEREVE